MPEDDPFLDAIRFAPHDDAPRLIYADWLSEQDDEHDVARGELIRTQIALEYSEPWSLESYDLRETEKRLLKAHQRIWETPLTAAGAWDVVYRRGFPAACTINAGTLISHGERIHDAAPTIERIVLRSSPNQFQETRAALATPPLPQVRALDLSDNQLGEAEASAIAESPWLAPLESLSLRRNYFTGEAISQILGATPELRTLDVADNGLNAQCAGPIMGAPRLPQLRSLDLSNNSLQEAAFVFLHRCSDELKSLGLAMLQHQEPFGAFLQLALPQSVESLDLSRNALNAAAVDWLAYWLRNRTMKRFTIARTQLGGEGLARFVKDAPDASIEALSLAGNALTDRDAITLGEWPAAERWRSLDLSSNQFTNVGAKTFAQEPRFHNLRELSLSRNRIGNPGVFALRASPYLVAAPKVDTSENTPAEAYRG